MVELKQVDPVTDFGHILLHLVVVECPHSHRQIAHILNKNCQIHKWIRQYMQNMHNMLYMSNMSNMEIYEYDIYEEIYELPLLV